MDTLSGCFSDGFRFRLWKQLPICVPKISPNFQVELATKKELWYTGFINGAQTAPDRFGKQDIRAAPGSAGLFSDILSFRTPCLRPMI